MPFDRRAYNREYMRHYRDRQKEKLALADRDKTHKACDERAMRLQTEKLVLVSQLAKARDEAAAEIQKRDLQIAELERQIASFSWSSETEELHFGDR